MKALVRRGLGWAVVVLMAAGAGSVRAGTVYVSTAGNDANDGLSWGTAKLTVQAGLNAAAAGDQVWVAAGTYVQCVTLKVGVGLYGGFAGTETDLSQRDWVANVTVLDGNQAGSVVYSGSNAQNPTRIDGFTIRNGTGTASGPSYIGGGIYCYYSSPTIANNTITNNGVSSTSTGGGIYCRSSSAMIVSNTILENSATIAGGIGCNSSSNLTIRNNTITGNSAHNGAGIHCASSSPTIANNTIAGNGDSSSVGGGIFSDSSTPLIAYNLIAGNTASGGGGIWCTYGLPKIACNTIAGNGASTGGGIQCVNCNPTIANNTIAANVAATAGGAIYCNNSDPVIVNTVITFNSSGLFYKTGVLELVLRCNCVYGNTAYNFSGLTDPTGTNGNISADPLFVSASPGADGIWGTADDTFANLHLLPGSPCIDAGSNADVPADSADLNGNGNTTEPLPFDLAGASRFADDPDTADTGLGTAPIVDIGAYEYHSGDASGDGHVDVLDLLDLVYSFGTVKGNAGFDPTCDFNHDGAVDVVDLLDLVYNFGT